MKNKRNKVYKLVTLENPDFIQGLVSIYDKSDHVFMNLIESAVFNKGARKLYNGVAGNLIAFVCKESVNRGFDGYIAFDAKTNLINHYKKSIGARYIGDSRMIVDGAQAQILINKYFKS